MISVLKLPFSFDADALKSDAGRFTSDEWTAHFNVHNYEGDWSGIALRAAGNARVALYPDPTADSYVDTENLARCSYVPTVLQTFDCNLESVRFLRLGPGSRIREHRDYDLSFEDGLARIHIPVATNNDVEFFLAGQRQNMHPGEAWYLNFNLNHNVENKSSQDRIHLVIDCVVNDWLRRFFPADSERSDHPIAADLQQKQ